MRLAAVAACASAFALSSCALAATGIRDEQRGALYVPAAGIRLAPDEWRNIGFDATVRAYDAGTGPSPVAHANLLITIVDPAYGFFGTGWGDDEVARSWELGIGAELDVHQTGTGPLAVFAEAGLTHLDASTPDDPLEPVPAPGHGPFLRVGVTWCFSMRVSC